jgi:uncharacterized membrane protein YgaE (UPF0421/DUF939 family)
MVEPQKQTGLLQLIQAQRPNDRQSLRMAALYAAQVLVASSLLLVGYHYISERQSVWALVSAMAVTEPALQQSIVASATRIAASIVGGIAGMLAAHFLGYGAWQFLLTIVVVVFLCERLRLDSAVRNACITVVIVMMFQEGKVFAWGAGRVVAVVVGCVLALIVQLAFDRAEKLLSRSAIAAAKSAHAMPPDASSSSA